MRKSGRKDEITYVCRVFHEENPARHAQPPLFRAKPLFPLEPNSGFRATLQIEKENIRQAVRFVVSVVKHHVPVFRLVPAV